MPQSQQAATIRELASIKQALDEAAIVAITDRKGVITHVNDRFCQISKYTREELLGKTHRVINSGFHPREFFVEMWETIASGHTWEGEVCNRAKDGSLYWVNTCIVPFLNEHGEIYQYVSIRYEITQRKEAEQKLRAYSKRLEQSNEELEHFASIAAHDLQEPLRKIRAFSDRLVIKTKGTLPEEALTYLDRIQGAATRMQNLIDDLLTYSRVRTKSQPFVGVELNEVVAEVVSDLEIYIEQMQAKIEVAPLPRIEADSMQMHQLFQNLISNAIKFHRDGILPVVKIEASTAVDNECRIRVIDNGIGFEEKYLDRIFNIFQRLHGRGEYDGTGVGLAICRRIVERHNGAITAESTPGEGSTFIVTLPMKQPAGGHHL